MTTYEFINIWPTNLTSMRVAYGQSNVLRCSVTLAYDRFVTDFNYTDTNKAVAANAFSLLNSQEQLSRFDTRKEKTLEPQQKSPQQKMNEAGLGWYNLGGLL